MLYRATLVAVRHNSQLAQFHVRATGKPMKLALTAAMRKLLTILNALLRDGTPWRAIPEPLGLPRQSLAP